VGPGAGRPVLGTDRPRPALGVWTRAVAVVGLTRSEPACYPDHTGDDDHPADVSMTGALPLEGLRVLELGHIVAGPSAGLLLADLGADVVKVERPGEGDQTRGMPAGNAANFHFLNRNKRSITVDLKGSTEGRELFLRLVKTSDVVIDNFAHGAVEALGLGYDVLARVNPGVIYLALKGFLPGPYEARPFLDELAQMSAGLAFMTGPRGQPMRAGASVVDVGAAAYGVIGVLAALQQRARTGVGQKITSGLYETTVFWVGQWLANYGATGEPSVPMPEIRQGTRMGWGIYQLFTAADGEQVFIGITSNGHWERFCKAFALDDLLADERLGDNARRVAARDWLPGRIAEEMRRHASAELAERLERARVPFAPLRRPDQLVDDPHLNAARQFVETPLPGRPPAKLPKMPVRSSAFEFELRRPAPRLGEHTREVLEERGLAKDEIDALASRRVIG
jgi:crotonobetainyl-CoA:carnitine CoA-transferase CaiB-like acyl-CoA transferase